MINSFPAESTPGNEEELIELDTVGSPGTHGSTPGLTLLTNTHIQEERRDKDSAEDEEAFFSLSLCLVWPHAFQGRANVAMRTRQHRHYRALKSEGEAYCRGIIEWKRPEISPSSSSLPLLWVQSIARLLSL